MSDAVLCHVTHANSSDTSQKAALCLAFATINDPGTVPNSEKNLHLHQNTCSGISHEMVQT